MTTKQFSRLLRQEHWGWGFLLSKDFESSLHCTHLLVRLFFLLSLELLLSWLLVAPASSWQVSASLFMYQSHGRLLTAWHTRRCRRLCWSIALLPRLYIRQALKLIWDNPHHLNWGGSVLGWFRHFCPWGAIERGWFSWEEALEYIYSTVWGLIAISRWTWVCNHGNLVLSFSCMIRGCGRERQEAFVHGFNLFRGYINVPAVIAGSGIPIIGMSRFPGFVNLSNWATEERWFILEDMTWILTYKGLAFDCANRQNA